MKEEVARGWAAYLRTPGLKQAKWQLMRGDGSACCLGHLCVFLGIEKRPANGETYSFRGETKTLPDSVTKQVGMRSCVGDTRDNAGFFVGDKVYDNLSDLNDHSGLTLPEIADVIEDNWERL